MAYKKFILPKVFALVIFSFIFFKGLTQKFILYGYVYDKQFLMPLSKVKVFNISGDSVLTDSIGFYSITVKHQDSIKFVYNDKATDYFSTSTIYNGNLDILLHVKVTDLPQVMVQSKNYRLDSLQNRSENLKYFNFNKPGLNLLTDKTAYFGTIGVGFDLNSLINVFRFKHNRQLEALRNRLILQEQENYINHRYNKNLVYKITHFSEPTLSHFMEKYRPEYFWLEQWNDIELSLYIQQSYKAFLIQNRRN